MEVKPFTPNYLRNVGKDFSKHDKNGTEERPEPTKKRTVIKNAIKTVDEVEPALQKAIKGKRKAGRPKKAVTSGESVLPKLRKRGRPPRVRPSSQESIVTVGENEP